MKQGKENFEFVKDKNDEKGNYIFQKDKLTKYGFYFVAAILIILVTFLISL
ncbi:MULTISPECIES: hypothetical protein [unclassified Algibacter]|uniref:hypothetical protein n=1 Tax=unclassified Algibacter TaxID=2615009 RepID=UPI00131B1A7C|nr:MULTISPECIES: hypothetical protein [unclassified Algibacter]MCL5127978.1 hypothetical protein [Algibacter sp. L4_22]